jgi:hypothetical protein
MLQTGPLSCCSWFVFYCRLLFCDQRVCHGESFLLQKINLRRARTARTACESGKRVYFLKEKGFTMAKFISKIIDFVKFENKTAVVLFLF